ncbi:hypothetical protein AB3N59_03820 [Leptospira sp. WS92.C1]
MKTTLPKLFMIVLSVYFNVSCYIGTQRDACKYNLKDNSIFGPTPDSCSFGFSSFVFTKDPDETDAEFEYRKSLFLNYNLLNCFQYYERLQECNKEENRFIPSIYGINSNPTSDTFTERIAEK